MGSLFSSPLAHAPLVGPMKPVAGINASFCSPVRRTLRFPRKADRKVHPHGREIKEAVSGKVLFRFGGQEMHKGELQDHNGTPVAFIQVMKRSAFKTLLHVSTDAEGEHPIITIQLKPSTKTSKMVQVRFKNVVTGKDCDLGVEMDLETTTTIVWMDETASHGAGARMPIARFRECEGAASSADDAELVVAPNVDVAMVMAVVLAMLDQNDLK